MTDYSGTTVEERAAMDELLALAWTMSEKAENSFGNKKEIYEKIFSYVDDMIEDILEDNPNLNSYERSWTGWKNL